MIKQIRKYAHKKHIEGSTVKALKASCIKSHTRVTLIRNQNLSFSKQKGKMNQRTLKTRLAVVAKTIRLPSDENV